MSTRPAEHAVWQFVAHEFIAEEEIPAWCLLCGAREDRAIHSPPHAYGGRGGFIPKLYGTDIQGGEPS